MWLNYPISHTSHSPRKNKPRQTIDVRRGDFISVNRADHLIHLIHMIEKILNTAVWVILFPFQVELESFHRMEIVIDYDSGTVKLADGLSPLFFS